MIMAGGTGGHVFPGLAVAEALRARHAQRRVARHAARARSARRAAARHRRRVDLDRRRARARRLGLGSRRRSASPAPSLQALGALRRRRPAAVLGMGGFVAGPGGLAAWLTRKPLLLHEQNAVAGTTNRLLAPLAARVFTAFPDTFPARPARRGDRQPRAQLVRGRPTRRAQRLARAPRRAPPPARRRRQPGRADPESRRCRSRSRELPAAERPEVWHQAGRATRRRGARSVCGRRRRRARRRRSSTTCASAYRWADLVVARAGGITLAELAIVGVGAILVPFAAAIDDHQTLNARHFVGARRGSRDPRAASSRARRSRRALASCLARSRQARRDGRGRARAGAARTRPSGSRPRASQRRRCAMNDAHGPHPQHPLRRHRRRRHGRHRRGAAESRLRGQRHGS